MKRRPKVNRNRQAQHHPRRPPPRQSRAPGRVVEHLDPVPSLVSAQDVVPSLAVVDCPVEAAGGRVGTVAGAGALLRFGGVFVGVGVGIGEVGVELEGFVG